MEIILTSDFLSIVALTFTVSLSATFLAVISAVPLSFILIESKSKFAKIVVVFANGLMSVPAVVIGLICYMVFSGSGFLGFLNLLYTPYLMVIAQFLLAFPIMLSMTVSSMKPVVFSVGETIVSLGASEIQKKISLLYEGRRQLATAAIVGFSRVVGETGMTLMVGGNIKGQTRVMTTTIALETMKGNFEIAVYLGIILLITALLINLLIYLLSERKDES